MYFFLRISLVHVFCYNFSRVRMFYDDNDLKSVLESTQHGIFLSWKIVESLTKN